MVQISSYHHPDMYENVSLNNGILTVSTGFLPSTVPLVKASNQPRLLSTIQPNENGQPLAKNRHTSALDVSPNPDSTGTAVGPTALLEALAAGAAAAGAAAG